MIKAVIAKLIDGYDLTRDESALAMAEIMSGHCTDAQIGAFLVAMRVKGERVEEISGAASVMRAKATFVSAPEGVIDTCGTGGDELGTFNISTAVAIVAAAGGACVAKHGNRAVSSSSGSSQVLENLGVNINASVEVVEKSIKEAGIGFLFAPLLHGAMKHALGPRREMGVRTIFNILGPLTNPAGAKRQLMGVYASHLVETMALVLRSLGSVRALIVHGHDGLDEITLSEETAMAFLDKDEVSTMVIAPEDFAMERVSIDALQVSSPAESAGVIKSVFAGVKGAARNIVQLNAGAALYVAGKVDTIAEGVSKAGEVIDCGEATETLRKLVSVSQGGDV